MSNRKALCVKTAFIAGTQTPFCTEGKVYEISPHIRLTTKFVDDLGNETVVDPEWMEKHFDLIPDAFHFGTALTYLKSGLKVARSGWNGKGMWLAMVKGHEWNIPVIHHAHAGIEKLPWIGMKTADIMFVPWLASQTDVLAEDWTVVE